MEDDIPQYEFSAEEEQGMRQQASQAQERAARKLGGVMRQFGSTVGKAAPPLAIGEPLERKRLDGLEYQRVLYLERLQRQSSLRFQCHRALMRVALWANEMAARLDK
jgi:hypothetical protein